MFWRLDLFSDIMVWPKYESWDGLLVKKQQKYSYEADSRMKPIVIFDQVVWRLGVVASWFLHIIKCHWHSWFCFSQILPRPGWIVCFPALSNFYRPPRPWPELPSLTSAEIIFQCHLLNVWFLGLPHQATSTYLLYLLSASNGDPIRPPVVGRPCSNPV